MKIRVTHEITDQQRLTIATALGEQGLADRETTASWVESLVADATIRLDVAFTEARDLLVEALKR